MIFLLEAGVNDTDIIIAVTESDELNILACLMAKKWGAKIRLLVFETLII